jgi:hypothetical protein
MMNEDQPMSELELQPAAADETTYCAVHPDRETSLRCNKCERYMCAACAVQTPVGYRCRECVRQHDDKFFTGTTTDYMIVFGVSAVLSAVGLLALVLILRGWLLFTVLLAFPIGGGIGELALRLTQRRRGRYSGYVGAAGAVAGSLLLVLTGQLPLFSLTFLVYVGIVAFTIYGRFRMRI